MSAIARGAGAAPGTNTPAGETRPLLELKDVHAHRRVPHPARRGPDGARRPGDHAAGPQRRRQDHHAAHHHGPVESLAGQCALRRRGRRRTRRARVTARHGAPRRRLRTREHGHLRRPVGEGEHPAGRARRRQRQPARHGAAGMDLRVLPRAAQVLAASGRQAFRRAEADAGGRARHHRTAPAAADRRTQQGPGAGHRAEHDRRLHRAQAGSHHHPAGRTELQFRAPGRRPRGRHGRRPRGARRRHGAAGRGRGAADAPARPFLGSHQ